jgi:putative ABC transport system permease protein
MESLRMDLRLTLRLLGRNPGFAAVVVLTLALGIGANSCMFSVVDAVLLQSLPFRDPGRLVALWSTVPDSLAQLIGSKRNSSSIPNLQDWAAQNHVFEGLSAYDFGRAVTVQSGGEPERVEAMQVYDDFFPVLGVEPALGRSFLPQEHARGGSPVVMLSNGYWRRRFGAQPDVIGGSIIVNETPHTVVGVLPAGFRFGASFAPYRISREPEIWRPLVPDGRPPHRGNNSVFVVARLKPGVSLRQAQAEMSLIADNLARQYPATNKGFGVEVLGLHESMRGSYRTTLRLLWSAVSLVLLIACVNIANLFLARASDRERDVAIRSALGAGRGRMVRQLLTESLLLALLGGGFGLALAYAGCRFLNPYLAGFVKGLPPLAVNNAVVGFTFGISLVTGILFGLAPIYRLSGVDLNDALRKGARGTAGSGRRLSGLLVMSEVALSMLLLIGAGLLLKSLFGVWQAGPGYREENLLAVNLDLAGKQFADPLQRAVFWNRLLERLQTLPGIESAALSSCLPNASSSNQVFRIPGRPELDRGLSPFLLPNADTQAVSAGYFRTVGIPLEMGRLFDSQDTSDSPRAAVINRTMARRYWPGRNPLGAELDYGSARRTVVGVVGDIRERGLDREPYSHVYLFSAQENERSTSYALLRASENLTPLAASLLKEIHALAPAQAVRIRTMESILSDSLATPRLVMSLMGAFALIALVLTLVGVYGVTSRWVSQRVREIGIRTALGASRRTVERMILGQGLNLVLPGAGLGLLAASAATRLLASQLCGVAPTDPMTFGLASTVLLVTAATACYLPARRAARQDPLVALRSE